MHEETVRRSFRAARALGARVVVASAVALLALFLPAGAAVAQSGADVEARDNEFVPDQVEVTAGESVDWTHTGDNPHTITDEGGRFDEETSTGDEFSYTYDEPGTYPYYCRFHGAEGGVGMSGVVVVEAAEEEPSEEEPAEEEPSEEEPAEEEPAEEEPAEEEPAEEEPAGDGDAAVTGSISAADQTGDGTTVQVDSVEISGSPGFVVVHLDQDGAPGPVLGHEAIPEGTSTGVQVSLDEALESSATLWPMLHTDQGSVGTYEFPGADVPVMADGEVVMVPIEYTVGLAFTGPPTRADAPWVAAIGVALAAAGAALVWRTRPAAARD